MRSVGLISLTVLATCLFCPMHLHCQDEPPSYLVTVAQDSFKATGYSIQAKSNSQWKEVGDFTVPTVSLLLQYRPQVRGHFGFDEVKERFIDVVEDVSSTIGVICAEDGKLWVGFDFYEGEGWEGYGGIGFYDPKTNMIGILRHPALVDYSVKSLLVTDSVLCIQTVGHYELSSSVGNGLVIIDRHTLSARAIIPPGTSTLWDKDDPASADSFYNRPIPEIIGDHRFVENKVPQYSSEIVGLVQTIGLDSFMVRTAHAEREIRERAVSNAKVSQELLLLPTLGGGWSMTGPESGVKVETGEYYTVGPDGAIRIVQLACPIDGVAFFTIQLSGAYPFSGYFAIRPDHAYPDPLNNDMTYSVGQDGTFWIREAFRKRLVISIDKLGTQTKSCFINGRPQNFEYYHSVAVRVEVRALQE